MVRHILKHFVFAIGAVITVVSKDGKISNPQITDSSMSQNLMVNKIKGLINDAHGPSSCSMQACNNDHNKTRTVDQGPLSESSSSSSVSDSNDNALCSAATEPDKRLPSKRLESAKLRNEKGTWKDRKFDAKSGSGVGKEKEKLTVVGQVSKDKPSALVSVLTTATTTTTTMAVSSMFNRVSTTVSSLSSSVSSSSITSSHSSSSVTAYVSNVNDKKRDLVSSHHSTFGTSINADEHVTSMAANASTGRSGKNKKGDVNSSLTSSK